MRALRKADQIDVFEFIDVAAPALLAELPGADMDDIYFTSETLTVPQLVEVAHGVDGSVGACVFRLLQTVTVIVVDEPGILEPAAAPMAAPKAVEVGLTAISGRTES